LSLELHAVKKEKEKLCSDAGQDSRKKKARVLMLLKAEKTLKIL
jgi:hypothetical protein